MNDKVQSIILSALMVLSVVAMAGAVSAATTSDVSLTPSSDTVNVGQTTTYQLVVDNPDNGVGTVNITITSSNVSAAEITGVDYQGAQSFATISFASDNSSVSIEGGAAQISDGLIANITVRGANAGSADLNLDVTELADQGGSPYTVSGTNNGSLTVSAQASNFDVEITDVSRTSISQGDSYTVTANVTNTGTASGTQDVTYELGNGTATPVSQTQSVTLGAGNSTTITYTISGQTTSNIPVASDYSHTVSQSGAGSSDTSTPTGGFVVAADNESDSFLEILDKNGNNDGIINVPEVLDAIDAFNNDEQIGNFDVGVTQVLDAIEAFNSERSVGS